VDKASARVSFLLCLWVRATATVRHRLHFAKCIEFAFYYMK
jgi:hypothetical protein